MGWATPRWGYLGPEGTFTEAALDAFAAGATVQPLAMSTVGEALEGVRAGSLEAAVVPFENSLEGSVAGTLDDLADPRRDRLVITRELLLPVSFALLARPGTELGDLTAVATIPAAEAQCRAWLRAKLPGIPVVPASSTAEAARDVAESRGSAQAAIASTFAGARYGLVPLAEELEQASGMASPVTRFVLVTRPSPPANPTGADRTTVVLFEHDDHPGALQEILAEFSVRGINLTRLESRPTGAGIGNYCFTIECVGHVAEARVGEALSALHRVCAEVLFLGSYPRGDSAAATVSGPTTDEAAFAAAAAWLARVRTEG
jgi:prephenate dehydratase